MSNAAYWNRRINIVYDNTAPKSIKATKALFRREYGKMERITKKIYDSVQAGKISRSDLYKVSHFQKLLEQIEKQDATIARELDSNVTEQLQQAYEKLFPEVMKGLKKDGFSVLNKSVPKYVAKKRWIGEGTYSTKIWGNIERLGNRIREDIISSIVQGTDRGTLVKNLKADYNAEFYQADRLIRTETMHTLNQSAIDQLKDEGCEYVQIYAAEDERTCEECAEYHEQIYRIDEAPMLPIHPNCRCTYAPVTEFESSDDSKNVDNDGKK